MSAKMRIAVVLLVTVVLMVMVELSETRGRGGGRSGGFRSSRSRGSSGGSSSKPKITKNTPIKATSARSPVIVSQTKPGLRSSTFKKVVFAYLVTHYAFSSAPVYRQGYPMYRSYVSIPEERAVRVTYERERLLDDEGKLCLASARSQTIKEEIDDNLVDLNTTVKYKNGETKTLHGVYNTLSLEDIKDQDFEVCYVTSGIKVIVEERAVRVIYESERLLDNEGKLCLKITAGNQTMKERIDDNLVYLNTTVKCKNRETKTLHGVNNTLSLEDVKDQEVRVTSLAKYNITIVTGTTCTHVEKTVEGTMVTLYETNPNGSSQLNINKKLLSILFASFAIINRFRHQ
ncbi:hypothetical protein AWC38_SpisGene16546 [Stylophora pistillata]|uniref:Uncharacterized protein n=1 Tax=Stylophora pistillata TaxID=50429 RepID=A0A2B4RN73_STYPI|nr:hypothetical protein AWC38_SpisGene16546 [Stylophora pistillata]